MIPDKIYISNQNLATVIAVCHKEIQTNNVVVKDSGISTDLPACSLSDRLLLPPVAGQRNTGSIKIFEFNQIIKEPGSAHSFTVIKDSISEEIRDHSDNESDEPTSNRYRYCREVIKPYLKNYPADCPESDEKLIKEILDSIHEDFPDYQPCFADSVVILDDSDSSHNKTPCVGSPKSSSKIIKNSASQRVSASTSCSSKLKMETTKDCSPKKPDSNKIATPPKSSAKDCPPTVDKCPEKDQSKVGTSSHTPPDCKIETVTKAEVKEKEKEKPTTGTCDDLDKNKGAKKINSKQSLSKSSSNFSIESLQKNIMDVHSEAMTTLKVAAEDLFSKVCQLTKDAVTLIKKESVRHLSKITTAKKSDNITEVESFSEKISEKKSSESVKNFKFFESPTQDNKNQNQIDPTEFLQKMVEKMDSTVSSISQHIDLNKLASLLKTSEDSNERTSKYDNPTPPKKISNIIVPDIIPPSNNNTFTNIKSKICSIFCEDKKDAKARKCDSKTSAKSDQNVSDDDSEKIVDRCLD